LTPTEPPKLICLIILIKTGLKPLSYKTSKRKSRLTLS
jgi:hypothetical protein